MGTKKKLIHSISDSFGDEKVRKISVNYKPDLSDVEEEKRKALPQKKEAERVERIEKKEKTGLIPKSFRGSSKAKEDPVVIKEEPLEIEEFDTFEDSAEDLEEKVTTIRFKKSKDNTESETIPSEQSDSNLSASSEGNDESFNGDDRALRNDSTVSAEADSFEEGLITEDSSEAEKAEEDKEAEEFADLEENESPSEVESQEDENINSDSYLQEEGSEVKNDDVSSETPESSEDDDSEEDKDEEEFSYKRFSIVKKGYSPEEVELHLTALERTRTEIPLFDQELRERAVLQIENDVLREENRRIKEAISDTDLLSVKTFDFKKVSERLSGKYGERN